MEKYRCECGGLLGLAEIPLMVMGGGLCIRCPLCRFIHRVFINQRGQVAFAPEITEKLPEPTSEPSDGIPKSVL